MADPSHILIHFANLQFQLLPQRAALCARTLFIADLHLGKGETFRASGIPVPAGDVDEQLHRLANLIETTHAERVIVLGDLLHAQHGLTDRLIRQVAQWRNKLHIRWSLVPGNHDHAIENVAQQWHIELLTPGFQWNGLELRHDPAETRGHLPWLAGHIHPACRIGSRASSVKLPAFHLVNRLGLVLPAFSLFTAGATVSPRPADSLFPVTPRRVISLFPTSTSAPAVSSLNGQTA